MSTANAAGSACLEGAETGLEKLYCEVVAEGGGAGLPSPTDFKRNDPQVQALLLRRPAGRLGLEVPQPGASATADARTQTEQADTQPEVAEPENNPPADGGQLADCRLEGQRITCPERRFDLAMNQPNSRLADGALEPDNRLGLSSYKGSRKDEEAVRRYLSDAYDRYIPKMVDIGLGANTMSFTAFHHAFHIMEDGGVDFARRMEQTFTLLKQDKKNLAVKPRYHDELPGDLSLCMEINRDIVVCDDVGTNWVYISPSG
ncbi:hypothetical protein DIT72_04750 [Marinobacter orientalis]|uniref:Uncharacterized protein n=1 Tax=Marinobacter orientalis TaxID=1928859 RepID=A0A7Y0R9L3_9GAMM|nr:hypothetical protein [Marinobacter orientalis]TGX52055.1 hypothetical protein DIT72_04750 [Marinobacter orientalis]